MAIARDATSAALDGTFTATSISVTHVCTGSNLILICCLAIGGNQVATATYNGVSMTSIGMNFSNRSVQMFYLVNPATGSNALTASWSSAGLAYIEGMSYTGASQTGQPDSSNTAGSTAGVGTSFSAATTVVAANCWLVGAGYATNGIGTTFTASGLTSINVQQQNANATELGMDSNGTVSTGSQSLGWTQSLPDGGGVGIVLASIAPAGAITTVTSIPSLILTGVGT